MLAITKLHVTITLLILNSCLIIQTKTQDLNSIFSSYLSNFTSYFPLDELLNLNDELMYNITALISSVNAANRCNAHLLLLLQDLGNKEEWAFRMIDATAKPQSGFLFGNVMQIGNYDECIKIKTVTTGEHIKGKYCTARYEPHIKYGKQLESILGPPLGNETKLDQNMFPLFFRTSYGFCIPHECRAQDIQQLVDALEEDLKSPLHFKFVDDYCDTDQPNPLSTAATITAVIFSGFALICLFSTIYDVRMHHKQEANKSVDIFKAFSFYSNGRKMLSTKTSEETLKCLNGLRVISMMWIVLAHQYLTTMVSPIVNSVEVQDLLKTTKFSLVLAAGIAVDTFFVVSGFLVVYLFMKSKDRGVKFSVVMFYLHRLIRLTPSLGMVVLFTGTLFMYISSGPLWPAAYATFQKSCEENWWITMIYFNNYIQTDHVCVGPTWYLAVDTQMYLLSPIILFTLTKWPKQTIATMACAILLSCAYVFEITLNRSFGVTLFQQGSDDRLYIYYPTYVRGATYLIGMICGYIVHKIHKNPQKHSKLAASVLWIAIVATLAGIIYSYGHFSSIKYDAMEASFFNSLSRIGWAIAISLVIVLCSSGYGGPINTFLSWPIFTILIKLNYSVYLLHFNVIFYFQAQNRTPGYLNDNLLVYQFMGSYVWTLIVSLVWTLTFESPLLIIEKCIFKIPVSKKENGKPMNGEATQEVDCVRINNSDFVISIANNNKRD